MKTKKSTINPYRVANNLLKNRISWDLKPESWRSRKRIREWKDRYSGEKAVILCNGPSLLKSDFKLLDGTFTFGLNKINLLFDKFDFRPSCIVAVNKLVIEQNEKFFNETDIPLFIERSGIKHISSRRNIAFLHCVTFQSFARDCSFSVHRGGTVTYVALQLAFHMGFREVALIGCDHNFVTKGPANQTVVSGQTDQDHFDPIYFAGGVKWQLPDLISSDLNYTTANSVFEENGRRVFNATEGGSLEEFERISLQEFVAAK